MYTLRCHWVAVYVNFLIFQIVQSKMQASCSCCCCECFIAGINDKGIENVKMRPEPSPVILSPVLTATVFFYLYFSTTVCKFLTIPIFYISLASNLQLRLSKSFTLFFSRQVTLTPVIAYKSNIFENIRIKKSKWRKCDFQMPR
jgi:hypothetical protein